MLLLTHWNGWGMILVSSSQDCLEIDTKQDNVWEVLSTELEVFWASNQRSLLVLSRDLN